MTHGKLEILLWFLKNDNTVEGHTCEPDEVIHDWLKGTFVVVVENNWTFSQDEYGKRSLTPDCYFHFHSISSSTSKETSRYFSMV